MQSTAPIPPVQPPLVPSPDQPGTIVQQMSCILDWLSLPDDTRRDPRSWEQSRRRRLPHARRAAP